MTAEEVKAGLAIAELALSNHAQLLAEGQLNRAAIYNPMHIEADGLIRMLAAAPESERDKVESLLGRYEMLLADLVD